MFQDRRVQHESHNRSVKNRGTMEKAKARIRRKAKALMRWQRKNGLTADKAAKGNYRISYETLKDWGYCSMVNAYYKKDMY